MEPDQFRQFMTAFQEQQMALITQLFTQLSLENKHDSSNNCTNIVPFENFNPKIEKFSSFLERFENYYTMKEVKDENKIAQLLCASIGSTHYNNLAAFLGPEKPVRSLAYDVLTDSFKQILIPRKNVVVSQHYFLNVFQKDGQSISDFVATLQRDISDCEFNVKCECENSVSISDVFLRAQFIRGLWDDWLREQVLQSGLTKFDGILSKAIALEASKIESRVLSQHQNISSNTIGDMNKILTI